MPIQFRHGQLAALLTIFGNLGAGQDLVTDCIGSELSMDYSRACELLGFTTPKSLRDNADLAKSRLRSYQGNQVALRYLVACNVLIKADQECN